VPRVESNHRPGVSIVEISRFYPSISKGPKD
jgi:hypothetical protein